MHVPEELVHSGLADHNDWQVHTALESRLNTSAYVSICQHMSAYVSIQHTSAYVSIRQNTSAYVSIRQHVSTSTLAGSQYLYFCSF
jgi:hypothetical protein